MNENNGYLKLARSIVNDKIWCDSDMFKFWFLLLSKARYKDGSTLMNGNKIELTTGQFITGRESLYKEFNKGVKKKKIVSESTLWNWLKRFESEGKLNIKTTNKYSIITVINWHKYQGYDEILTSSEQQVDNNVTSSEQQVDITLTQKKKEKKDKKVNKDKKEENITFSSLIEEFTSDDKLINVLNKYVEMRKKDNKFTTYALQLNLTKLSKVTEEMKIPIEDIKVQIALVNKAIESSWKSFFPLKGEEVTRLVNDNKKVADEPEKSNEQRQAALDEIKRMKEELGGSK